MLFWCNDCIWDSFSLGVKKHPYNTPLQVWVSDGLIQMPRTISLPRADTLFIHHTSSIRSLIHVQDKTTAKLLDYREMLLRHLSCWWKQHRPLTFAGSRSIMRPVRQGEEHVLIPLPCTVLAQEHCISCQLLWGDWGLLITGEVA